MQCTSGTLAALTVAGINDPGTGPTSSGATAGGTVGVSTENHAECYAVVLNTANPIAYVHSSATPLSAAVVTTSPDQTIPWACPISVPTQAGGATVVYYFAFCQGSGCTPTHGVGNTTNTYTQSAAATTYSPVTPPASNTTGTTLQGPATLNGGALCSAGTACPAIQTCNASLVPLYAQAVCTVTLSTAQLLAFDGTSATAISIISAPGSGKKIDVGLNVNVEYVAGTIPFASTSSEAFAFSYAAAPSVESFGCTNSPDFSASTSQTVDCANLAGAANNAADANNSAILLWEVSNALTLGDGSGVLIIPFTVYPIT